MEPIARVPMRADNDAADAGAITAALLQTRRDPRHATRIANLGAFTGYRIGLDIGNGNIGWCVLFENGLQVHFLTTDDIAAHNLALPRQAPRIQLPDLPSFVPLGTHKFQARDPDAGVSFSKIRAEKKAARGLLDARQRRRLHVRKALQDAGLLPSLGEKPAGHNRISADNLRVRLLDPAFPAHAHDLGRALLNALRRRGWMKPIGRAGADEDSTFGKRATENYRAALKACGCETIGQFLHRCARDARADGQPIRKRHKPLAWQQQPENARNRPKDPASAKSYEAFQYLTPTLELVMEEARLLRERQESNVPADEQAWAAIEAAAEFRRSLQATTPGTCQYFRQERRCVRALPSFQRFRILQQVSNLRDVRGQELGPEMFTRAVAILEQNDRISVTELGRQLGAGRLRLEEEGKPARTLVGPTTDLALAAALGPAWLQLGIEARDDWTMRFLRRHAPGADGKTKPWCEHAEEALEYDAGAAFGPDALAAVENGAEKALSAADKFASVSQKAARLLASTYERRLSHEQRLAELRMAGAPEPSLALYEELPYYGEVMPDIVVPAAGFAPPERTCSDELAFGRAANPDVHVVLNRIRVVVNAIIKMMGGILPTTCVVEVARSALSEDAAEQHRLKALEREKLNRAIEGEIAKICAGLGAKMPRGPGLYKLVDRWKAAVRQGWRDYDGSRIQRSALIDGAKYQLDHVSPAAFGEFRENNMVVSRFNGRKGRRLPWDAFGSSDDFRPALLAFAQFGLEQRVTTLERTLSSKRPVPAKKREMLQDWLTRTKTELAGLGGYGVPRPDVLSDLRRTLTDKPSALLGADEAEDAEPSARGARRPFDAGAQAALFCRFSPDARKPERDFAARDVANIGWSTKLALRYLRHLGADVQAIKPWATHALRCMFSIDKPRIDLRNHAVDAFLVAHFDAEVLRPTFTYLRGVFEELYDSRSLRSALARIDGGEDFFPGLECNIAGLLRELPSVATAHRADNRWNPGDAEGGSFGAIGGANIYSFRPSAAERRVLTAIAAKADKAPAGGRVMTRHELLRLLLDSDLDDRLRRALYDKAEVRYWSRDQARRKMVTTKLQTALPLAGQPGAFVDGEGKFAVSGGVRKDDRKVTGVAEFSASDSASRATLSTARVPIFRRGDIVIDGRKALVVTGLLADTRIIAYPVDEALREQAQKQRIIAGAGMTRFASDVLGRRLHRLRKDSGGLEPVPYPLREQ
jgi:CRISPR-associated endonuclease Csn1